MNKKLVVLTVAALALVLCGTIAHAIYSVPYYVTVVDCESEMAISGAQVTMVNLMNQEMTQATTDEKGRAQLSPDVGNCQLTVTAAQYFPYQTTVSVGPGPGSHRACLMHQ